MTSRGGALPAIAALQGLALHVRDSLLRLVLGKRFGGAPHSMTSRHRNRRPPPHGSLHGDQGPISVRGRHRLATFSPLINFS